MIETISAAKFTAYIKICKMPEATFEVCVLKSKYHKARFVMIAWK